MKKNKRTIYKSHVKKADVGGARDEYVQQLRLENETLKQKLRKHKRKPSRKTGYTLTFSGSISLVSSAISDSSILAFIGLGLLFWGILFLYVKSTRYVRKELLTQTAVSPLQNLTKMIGELGFQGKGIYMPSRHLKGLKTEMLFLAREKNIVIPSLKDAKNEKFFLDNPEGLFLVPPGQGLCALFEKELGVDFLTVNLNYLQENLRELFIKDLEIVESFEMNVNKNIIHVKITGNLYGELCSKVGESEHFCCMVGCPFCSSIACVITRSTGKPVVIEKASSENETVEVWYRILQG